MCPEIKYISKVKYLGLFFDQAIDNILRRLRTVSSYIYRICNSENMKLRQKVYEALGESVLQYGITVYSTCSKYKQQMIGEMLYKMLNNMAYGYTTETMFPNDKKSSLNILSLQNHLLKYEILIRC